MPISHQHTPYKYNEFVAPMDADYLIKAVDLKQNLYDQGTAAIEAKMQDLAGFDIAKEEDRAYANQELKKIYQAMQSGASKDFSNPQVVKSFLDVAKPLERDAIFQNAKNSTIELRNRQKTIAEIRAKHPDQYHQANESEYMDDLEEWMNNPNAGATLSHKEYTPWKDVSKEMTDITSKIKEDVWNENKQSGGWMTDKQIKEVTAERINSVIATLDPSYRRQIEIDASYQAKNTDDQTKWEAITADVKKVYDANMLMANTPNIENYVKDNPERLTAADYRRRAQLAMDQLNKLQGDKKLLDSAYSNHYINNWQDNMANIYAYRQEEEKITRDPMALLNKSFANSLELAKTNHALDWEYKQRELLLKGEAMKDANGNIVNNPDYVKNKDGKSYDASSLKFFGVNPGKAIVAGAKYEIPFTDGTSAYALNTGTKVQEILKNVLTNNTAYNTKDWFDEEGNVQNDVKLLYQINDKGELEYELSTSEEADESKEVKIPISAESMKRFLPATPSSSSSNETVNTEDLTPEQTAEYYKLFAK